MAIIEIDKLTKYYGRTPGIIDLDLEVGEGEIFGFIGPNGAGKSTTIRTLLGLISATSGSARVMGKDISAQKDEILPHIGYMPSEALFYDSMRVGEIISFSSKLRRKYCSEEAKLLCERFQLDTEKRVSELSLGNRKKVGIVCAMQHKPELYILDEPTSGLDPLMQREFFALIEERSREGATVFLSSHVLSEIQNHCHRAAIIREGRLVACDMVSSLTKTVARRVVIRGASAPPELDGVMDINSTNESVSFLYNGEIKMLLSALRDMQINDLTITEPTLEESFLHYYQKGGEQI